MSARADLLRMLEDADRPEQELHAEVLALVAKTKMSTKDILRVCGDFGLETTATCKQQTREQLLTSLVSKALVRARREEKARAEPAADKSKEDTVSVHTKHTSALQNADVLQAMSAKKRTSCTQHEKPEEGCNQDELSREKMKEHPTPVDELPPGEENRMIPNNLMSLFALYKADAEDREARLTRIIRSLTKKVESLECDLSTFREEAKKNEERLMKKVSDLSAKLGSASSDLSARIASLPTLLPTPAESSASSQQGDSAGVQAYSTSIRTPSGPTARSVPPHLSVPPQASQASRPRATNASTHSDRSQTTARPQLSTAEQKDTGETIAPTEQVQQLALDDEDNLWSLVTKKKPTGKKAVLYVGNLDETVTEEKLREYIQKRSEKAGIRQPDIFSCSIIRREEGELGSWGAHLAIDHASKENLRNRHFWTGGVYARPWNFRKHNLLDAPREGDSRPNLAAESPPAGPPGDARPQNN